MYTNLIFPDIKYLFGASKLMIFKLQLCPINHKTCRGSWNFIIMTWEGFLYPCNSHILTKSLSQCPKIILIIFYVKVFIPKHFVVFPAAACWLKALGIWIEGLWIRAEFVYEIGRTPTNKVSLVNLKSDLKAHVLHPLEGNNKGQEVIT